MLKSPENNLLKLFKIFSSAVLMSLIAPNVFAESVEYYNFPTGEHEGGGVRGGFSRCSVETSYPLPLIPQDRQILTASAAPKLFFDVSNVKQEIELDFLLLNQNNEVVLQDNIETNNGSRLISLDLKDTHNNDVLALQSNYHWYLVDSCQNKSEPKIVANGSLTRIELETKLVKQLNNATTIDRINIYQAANIWLETVEEIADARCDLSVTMANKGTSKADRDTAMSVKSIHSLFNANCPNRSEIES
ncbi:MAG: DUF928 domain-containing protein [Cyanobacteria bacterium P01_G01_bin.19]